MPREDALQVEARVLDPGHQVIPQHRAGVPFDASLLSACCPRGNPVLARYCSLWVRYGFAMVSLGFRLGLPAISLLMVPRPRRPCAALTGAPAHLCRVSPLYKDGTTQVVGYRNNRDVARCGGARGREEVAGSTRSRRTVLGPPIILLPRPVHAPRLGRWRRPPNKFFRSRCASWSSSPCARATWAASAIS